MIDSIISNLISNFIWILIILALTPVFKKIKPKLIEFLEAVNHSFRNSIYREASKRSINGLHQLNSYIIAMTFLVVTLTMFVSGSVAIIEDKNKAEEFLMRTEIGKSNNSNNDLKSLLSKSRKDAENVKKQADQYTLSIVSLQLFFLIVYCYAFIVQARYDRISWLGVNFDQYLAAIRPAIGEEKYIYFQSQWAKMCTKEDWESINKEMSVFHKHALTVLKNSVEINNNNQ